MPATFQVKIIGNEQAIGRLREPNVRRVINEEIGLACIDSAFWLEATAKTLVPKRTGNLEKAIRGNVRRLPSHWEVLLEVSETAPYGPYVEYGTGLYGKNHAPFVGKFRLPPGFNKAYPQGLSGTYPPWGFGAMPRGSGIPLLPGHPHPGMRPRPYIGPSLPANEPKIHARFEEAGLRIAERLTNGIG